MHDHRRSRAQRSRPWIRGAVVAATALVAPLAFAATASGPPEVLGIPVDFILFALTLLGVALFHHHTLRVALIGLATITVYKLAFTGFKTGDGIAGLIGHLAHEWVILTNLLCLLVGFALLSKHFEDSKVPAVLPKYLPGEWKGAFVLLVMVFVLSSFLDNIAAALIGGAMAHTVFRGKVHIGYLAAIVAASNAGGSGSVVGDTTTTMMWIDGVSPLAVLTAYVAAAAALIVCAFPAALQQHKHSPLIPYVPGAATVDWVRVGIVAFILVTAICRERLYQRRAQRDCRQLSLHRRCRGPGDPRHCAVTQAGLEPVAGGDQGHDFPAGAGDLRLHDAGGKTARGVLADGDGTGLHFRGVRQHPAHRTRPQAGRLRLGHARLHGGFRRLDDLVRLVRRRGSVQHVSGSQERGPLAVPRLACHGSVRRRLPGDAGGRGLASDPQARRHSARSAGGAAAGGGVAALSRPHSQQQDEETRWNRCNG